MDLCGPSNAVKTFNSVLDRDRSLHQDRTGPSPLLAASSFKSVSDPSHNGDFRAFVANGRNGQPPLPMGHESAPFMLDDRMRNPVARPVGPPAPAGASIAGPATPSAWVSQYHNGVQSPAFSSPAFSTPAASPAYNGNIHAGRASVAPATIHSVMAVPNQPYGVSHPLPLGLQYDPFTEYPSPGRAYSPSFSAYTQPYQLPEGSPLITAAPPAYGMSEAELQASFDRFEQYEQDFNEELDAWMAEHGPTAERRIDENMEILANELDQAHIRGDAGLFAEPSTTAEAQLESAGDVLVESSTNVDAQLESSDDVLTGDTDLSKTAAQIIDSVAITSETNEKFKNSRFLNLMERLAKSEVVQRGDDLVDAQTGESASGVEASSKGKEKATFAAEPSDMPNQQHPSPPQ